MNLAQIDPAGAAMIAAGVVVLHPSLRSRRTIPTVTAPELARALEPLTARRRKLLSYVHDDSWSWNAVCQNRARE